MMEPRLVKICLLAICLIFVAAQKGKGKGKGHSPRPAWGIWTEWSVCSAACGLGTQTRWRTCSTSGKGHSECYGQNTETRSCKVQDCAAPVNGGWSEWFGYGVCSASCGGGFQTRNRYCTNPLPTYGGLYCPGSAIERIACNSDVKCPPSAGWSEWSTFGECSHSCGGGWKTRTRTCTNPPPVPGGSTCYGYSSDYKLCNSEIPCVVNGGWSSWSVYGRCGKGGSQIRTRSCTNPVPSFGGADCIGSALESQPCHFPVDGNWGLWCTWSEWSGSHTSGKGKGKGKGEGESVERTRTRSRLCDSPAPVYGGRPCEGKDRETEARSFDY